jgi:hypothetical protein
MPLCWNAGPTSKQWHSGKKFKLQNLFYWNATVSKSDQQLRSNFACHPLIPIESNRVMSQLQTNDYLHEIKPDQIQPMVPTCQQQTTDLIQIEMTAQTNQNSLH